MFIAGFLYGSFLTYKTICMFNTPMKKYFLPLQLKMGISSLIGKSYLSEIYLIGLAIVCDFAH